MRSRRRPGPKAEIPNPHPAGGPEPVEQIDPSLLAAGASAIQSDLSRRQRDLRQHQGEDLDAAVRRVLHIVEEALTDAIWWSGLKKERVVVPDLTQHQTPAVLYGRMRGFNRARRHVGRQPPARPRDWCLWFDTSSKPPKVRHYSKLTKEWSVLFDAVRTGEQPVQLLYDLAQPTSRLVVTWPPMPTLAEGVRRALTGEELGRAGRSGRPHFLACCALGALLDVPPEIITDKLNHFRRTQRRPAR